MGLYCLLANKYRFECELTLKYWQCVAEDRADYEGKDDGASGDLYLNGADVVAKRSAMGLTAAGFAKQVGVTPATICRWEKIRKPFKMKNKYARFFK